MYFGWFFKSEFRLGWKYFCSILASMRVHIDSMILQNNFKIFHLDKDVKLSFP
jgi:hypothetical protein